jgi:ferrous iron transport protein A
MRLTDLKLFEKARIVSLEEDSLTLKLQEMGFVPGENVWVEHFVQGEDPIAVRISGYLVGLRKNEASLVIVEKY